MEEKNFIDFSFRSRIFSALLRLTRCILQLRKETCMQHRLAVVDVFFILCVPQKVFASKNNRLLDFSPFKFRIYETKVANLKGENEIPELRDF
jgi:hypothetical protein